MQNRNSINPTLHIDGNREDIACATHCIQDICRSIQWLTQNDASRMATQQYT